LVSRRHGHGVWLSPVERSVRVGEVPGSNPGTPIEYPAKAGPVMCTPG
jgi:hypothetical protein